MSPLSTFLLALGMSTDAFAAALGKGAGLSRPHPMEALRVGLIFGSIEAIAPVIGWGAGRAMRRYIEAFDHWIAFALLSAIGIKMIRDAAYRDGDSEKPGRHSFAVLALTAIGTSIDALAVGVTLAILNVNILAAALAIGAATFSMTACGILAGHAIGAKFGRAAEAAGGVVLIAIGLGILIQHTLM